MKKCHEIIINWTVAKFKDSNARFTTVSLKALPIQVFKYLKTDYFQLWFLYKMFCAFSVLDNHLEMSRETIIFFTLCFIAWRVT